MSDERGFTLVEVLVAATIVAVGLLATLGALESGQRVSTHSEGNQQAYAYAQARVEELASRDWTKLGVKQAPPAAVPGADADDPARFVTAQGRLLVPRNPSAGDEPAAGVPPTGEPFAVVGAAGVEPGPQTTTVGHRAATVYQYVTEVDPCMTVGTATACPTGPETSALRRITVVVTLADQGARKAPAPVWVSTVVANADAEALAL
jgi:prepilin-type N-terminal cleavage/methylation domain-containing protein